MKRDVLFINPGDQKKTYQKLANEFTAVATPAWTTLLAEGIRNRGYSVAIFDVNVLGWDDDCVRKLLEEYNPELIVLMVYGHNPSASTQTMPSARRIVRDIKNYNRDLPLAMGGTHPSALPQRTLAEEQVDYVIQGEGLYTIEGLLRLISGNCHIDEVKGLWRRTNEDFKFTRPAPLIENLDHDLPGYSWDLLPSLSNYRAHNMHCFQDFASARSEDFSDIRSPYVTLYTSLGCPFSCHYCCINAVFGKPQIRYWSVNRVISWIDQLVERYQIKNIRLEDELFILNPQRVERFCEALSDRGYDLNLWVYARVDTIKEKLLKKLKKAGINWICLGIESGNQKVRQNVNKHISKGIEETVQLIRANDIFVLGNYMFGLPEDDLASMKETLDLSMKLNCEFVNFYSVMAYPGSKLYESAELKGYLPASWGAYSQHSYETLPLPTKYLSAAEVLRYRDEAFDRYFTNPAYLRMIRDKFGDRVVQHLEKMVAVKIRRRLLEEKE